MNENQGIVAKIREVVLSVDPKDIVADARNFGLDVSDPKDFSEHALNYTHLEKLGEKYLDSTCKMCAIGGVTSGVGGIATTITLAGVDIANMAAQLYRLNQKLAYLNGFDPQSDLHQERVQTVYLTALGIDALAQAGIRSAVAKAATESLVKRGPASSPAIRLIIEVAKVLGLKMTKTQAGKLVPFVGGLIGGSVNYLFAKSAGKKMVAEYKSEYFDRWQLHNK